MHLKAEADRRGCQAPEEGTGGRVWATDPGWKTDVPDHHVPPEAGIGGGGCASGRGGEGGLAGILVGMVMMAGLIGLAIMPFS